MRKGRFLLRHTHHPLTLSQVSHWLLQSMAVWLTWAMSVTQLTWAMPPKNKDINNINGYIKAFETILERQYMCFLGRFLIHFQTKIVLIFGNVWYFVRHPKFPSSFPPYDGRKGSFLLASETFDGLIDPKTKIIAWPKTRPVFLSPTQKSRWISFRDTVNVA